MNFEELSLASRILSISVVQFKCLQFKLNTYFSSHGQCPCDLFFSFSSNIRAYIFVLLINKKAYLSFRVRNV